MENIKLPISAQSTSLRASSSPALPIQNPAPAAMGLLALRPSVTPGRSKRWPMHPLIMLCMMFLLLPLTVILSPRTASAGTHFLLAQWRMPVPWAVAVTETALSIQVTPITADLPLAVTAIVLLVGMATWTLATVTTVLSEATIMTEMALPDSTPATMLFLIRIRVLLDTVFCPRATQTPIPTAILTQMTFCPSSHEAPVTRPMWTATTNQWSTTKGTPDQPFTHHVTRSSV
mmetsp:Transcript_29881/g.69068  ORF Transcript_29881/g.69068 Transcript_29881/m.69068 type:complete len:232 (+) Transcript_29881:219-914(+)